ncbi:MAG: hypothetical protein HC880_01030 [Bacteroidia bacterium]|nr:hypothetical protein [Bacteroidia bacterium]
MYQRPHLDLFLEQCKVDFDLAIWSSAGSLYVERMVRQLVQGCGGCTQDREDGLANPNK